MRIGVRRGSPAFRRTSGRILLVSLLIQLIALVGIGAAKGADRPPSRAEAYAKEAAGLLGKNKFAEAADKYQLAAKEAAKEPGGADKAKKYLANYNLYRAMGDLQRG